MSAFELSATLQDLSRLVVALPLRFEGDEVSPKISHAEWEGVFKFLTSLPFPHYQKCVDPHSRSQTDTVTGNLADDLAEIWQDLKPGLSHLR